MAREREKDEKTRNKIAKSAGDFSHQEMETKIQRRGKKQNRIKEDSQHRKQKKDKELHRE